MYTLKVLGVGSAFAKNSRESNFLIFNSNFLIRGEKGVMLIDYGKTANDALDFYGIDRQEIRKIFISHLHNDHIGGLEELGILNRVLFGAKQTLVGTESMLQNLWFKSLRGGLEYLENSQDKIIQRTMDDYFHSMQVKPYEWFEFEDFPGLKIFLFKTDHIWGMESYGLILQTPRKKIFISGDTCFAPESLNKYATDADLILQDCQILENGEDNKLGVHASLRQLRTLPPRLKDMMYLYHYETRHYNPELGNEFLGYALQGQEFEL